MIIWGRKAEQHLRHHKNNITTLGDIMKELQLIQQTVKATYDYFVGWLKLDHKPLDDIKTLAAHVHLDEWTPGELAVKILDHFSIKLLGAEISDDMNYDMFDGELNTGNIEDLRYWVDSLGDGDLLLLDQVLWLEME